MSADTTRVEYTSEMVQEVIECRDNPSYFATKYCFVDVDERLMERMALVDNVYVLPGEGDTTGTILAYVLWASIFWVDRSNIIGSPKLQQAISRLHRMMEMFDNLPSYMKPIVRVRRRTLVNFDNGVTIRAEAVTPRFCRGLGPSIVVFDDFNLMNKDAHHHINHVLTPVFDSLRTQVILG